MLLGMADQPHTRSLLQKLTGRTVHDRKDVNLPLEGSVIPKSRWPQKPDVAGAFRKAGKGYQQLKELTAKSRSASKR
jgi:hypothetical protein